MMSNNEFIFFKDKIICNWNEQGMLLEGCLVVNFTINRSIDNEIAFSGITNAKMISIPSPQSIDVAINLKVMSMKTQNKKFNFKDMCESEFEIEDLFKMINKKITKVKK